MQITIFFVDKLFSNLWVFSVSIFNNFLLVLYLLTYENITKNIPRKLYVIRILLIQIFVMQTMQLLHLKKWLKLTIVTKVIIRVLWYMMLFLNNFDGVIRVLNLPMDPIFVYFECPFLKDPKNNYNNQ